ncbi:hypothetical protein QJS10_CPB18g00132 [Acorus calamus]|uniref:Uncharacterized protein n=1 Tax=Acorus calamus TaxID=4465 RepID=A0AAV9CNY0_ACOCL|nr:hypothetical protein QJS10_CPB18g00132 [Acorus calamus]
MRGARMEKKKKKKGMQVLHANGEEDEEQEVRNKRCADKEEEEEEEAQTEQASISTSLRLGALHWPCVHQSKGAAFIWEWWIVLADLSGGLFERGVAINFVRSNDIKIPRDIEQYYSTQIDEMPMNVVDLI